MANKGWSNPRDSSGRFINRPETVVKGFNYNYNDIDIVNAFIAGIQAKGSLLFPRLNAENYLQKVKANRKN